MTKVLYEIAGRIASFLCRLVYRVKIEGLENIPRKKGIVILVNQTRLADLLMLEHVTNRKVRLAAKKEQIGKLSKWVIRMFRAFAIDKQTIDISAYKTAMSSLTNGEAIAIRTQTAKGEKLSLSSLNKDAALFGAKAQAPFLPIEISSTYKPFSVLKISIGKPFLLERPNRPDSRAGFQTLSPRG
ncbi:MAG: 1-acyl-sn-glycerol-3-phosphate acyltransferase [Clostridiales bacterium]|nr:1-acyl-sn-glycerol-3-phosphate acyltransferase [Clostridiales bacterium]